LVWLSFDYQGGAVDRAFGRECINALIPLFQKFEIRDVNSANLEAAQRLDLDSDKGLFGAAWRVANAARFLAERTRGDLRTALLSTARVGYEYCGARSEKYRPSLAQIDDTLRGFEPFSNAQVLDVFEGELSGAVETTPPGGETVDSSQASPALETATSSADSASDRIRERFESPPLRSTRERVQSVLAEWVDQSKLDAPAADKLPDVFDSTLKSIRAIADEGRTFADFAPLDKDLAEFLKYLPQFTQIENPRELQDRAKACRLVAEQLQFGEASAEDYRWTRLAWLVSLYWNSQLTRMWGANSPQAVYDFVGYLSAIQAEIRYSDAEFLLLLRVSFSISRIVTHDGLLPLQFLTSYPQLRDWAKYSLGTIFASAGPGRVPPSRVKHDGRFARVERSRYAAILLESWTSDSDRAAATTILLEMSAWDASRAKLLLSMVFDASNPRLEIWGGLVSDMARHAGRVRVVRPNPWTPGTDKAITVEREAVAILAADVVKRCYQVVGGDLALRGHTFRDRRVPTFVCSADFGPLGLFKLDTADKISREVRNFSKYAQRLHPRYRASRCDPSLAVITEPDDQKQFVMGALTSYVFTDDETPHTLRAWFMKSSIDQAASLCRELFERALRPWYGHAVPATLDLFGEFPMLSREGLARLSAESGAIVGSGEIEPESSGLGMAPRWIESLLKYVETGECQNDETATAADELQVLKSYRSVCHGDLHLDNVLVIGKTGSEYPCVIDFEGTHEGYVLKDFGRFTASLLFRTYEWSSQEQGEFNRELPAVLLDWQNITRGAAESERVRKVMEALLAARQGILRAWQAGSWPIKLELLATFVASFLPFARYRDTSESNARFALALSSALVTAHEV
jgi:hypothetical protein